MVPASRHVLDLRPPASNLVKQDSYLTSSWGPGHRGQVFLPLGIHLPELWGAFLPPSPMHLFHKQQCPGPVPTPAA